MCGVLLFCMLLAFAWLCYFVLTGLGKVLLHEFLFLLTLNYTQTCQSNLHYELQVKENASAMFLIQEAGGQTEDLNTEKARPPPAKRRPTPEAQQASSVGPNNSSLGE